MKAEFNIGEKVHWIASGINVIITEKHPIHYPLLYTCITSNNKEVALYEYELISLHEHNMNQKNLV